MKRIVFLNPPSYNRYDSAGARFQATRVTESLWYPAWLGYAASLVPNSKLIDAPAENLSVEMVARKVVLFDIIIIYTSTPGLDNDIKIAEVLKREFPAKKIIFVGPHVSVLDKDTLEKSKYIDGVIRKEFDYPALAMAKNIPWKKIPNLTYRENDKIITNEENLPVKNLDGFPFVSKIYKRDLPIKSYHLPFALYPYMAIYAGRGCPNRCTFCLWPQTFTGRIYRKRSVDNVIREMVYIKNHLPEIKEIFFDDDTFTIDRRWIHEFCIKVAPLSLTWSCNARADLDRKILNEIKKAGCRVLVVGYESSNQAILNNVKKGINTKQFLKFTQDAHDAGLLIHGTFILGLPGETIQTMKDTLEFAQKLNLETLQVSIATPLPGTEFYHTCKNKGYLQFNNLINETGYQNVTVSYPNLNAHDIKKFNNIFLKKYYLRPAFILLMFKIIIQQPREFSRIVRNGYYFFRYLFKN